MRIDKVSLFHKELPMLCTSFSCSLEPDVSTADVVIAKVETDTGLFGHGESGCTGGYTNYAAGILATSAKLIERHLIHKDPRDINDIQNTMSMIKDHGASKAAFDMACWDILGKSVGKPLWFLLGGKLQERAPLYRSISMNSPKKMAEEIGAWRTEGYRLFQIRVGGGNLSEDVARIEACLSGRLPDEHFTVDAAGRWRVDEALHVSRAVEHLDFVLEQPCWTYDECLSVRSRMNRPIKLDNLIANVDTILRAHADDACDLLTIKISNIGGFSEARIARDIASAAGIPVTIESQWGTEITTSAMVHLALTTAPNRFMSCTDLYNYSSETVAGGDNLLVENGTITFADDKPGLGIDVDPESLGEPDIVIE
uniref:L-alanine-DL-glutamate epimerase n=1 Tax=Candidatus Kentrum sp. TC TaxID=2126339 RepID=A0A450YPV1_9GAMM|nr:MAG: L-alanine-DL-glutamate epimerase [Candidatus Kentron sp. TC]